MKKFCLFIISSLLLISVSAQHQKNIDGVIFCSSQLVPGATMDLQFSLRLINTDGEFGDSLALEFEEGVLPNTSPNDPFASTTYGQPGEAFNGAFDQLISWGDNNNVDGIGGIETQKIFNFTINVSVDDTVTIRKKVRYFISGDGMKFNQFGTPRDDSGSFYIDIQMPAADLKLDFQQPVKEYYSTPKNQLPDTIPLTAMVSNIGGAELGEQSAIVFDATNSGYYSASQLPRPFAKDDTVFVKASTAFKPARNQTYDFKIKVIAPDSNQSNNFDSLRFEVTDTTLARENGQLTDNITLLGTGLVGAVYELKTADTISSISVYLTDPQVGDSLRVEIYSMGLLPENFLSMSRTLLFDTTTSNVAGWYTLPILDTLILQPSRFFVAVNQLTSDRLSLGVNSYNYHDTTNFALESGAADWVPAESLGGQFANNLMIRVHTGSPWDLRPDTSTIGISERFISSKDLIYPNPCTSTLNYQSALNGQAYKILNVTGKAVQQGQLKGGSIDVAELPAGIYIFIAGRKSLKFVHN